MGFFSIFRPRAVRTREGRVPCRIRAFLGVRVLFILCPVIFLSYGLQEARFCGRVCSRLGFPLRGEATLLFSSLRGGLSVPAYGLALLPIRSRMVSLFQHARVGLPTCLYAASRFLRILCFLLLSTSDVRYPFSERVSRNGSLSSSPSPFLRSFSNLSISRRRV